MPASCASSDGSSGESVPSLFWLLVAAGILRLVVALIQSLLLSLHVLPVRVVCLSKLPLPLSYENT